MRPPSAHPASLRFSSETLPQRDRIAVWREVYGRAIRIDMEPVPDATFHVDLQLRSLPRLTTVLGTVGGIRGRRTRSLASDGNDDVALMIILSGVAATSQFGREATLQESDAVFFSCGDPGETFRPQPVRNLGVYVPRSAVDVLIPRVDEAFMRPIPRSSEALRLLKSYVGALDENLDENNGLVTPEVRQSVVTHVHDLVACIVSDVRGDGRHADAGGMRAARLRAIKEDIAANAWRQDLSLDGLAMRQNISPSYIRKLLEADGTSYTDLVLGQRLLRAHRMLTDPRQAARRVSEIAFAVGFNELSYFSRAFRRRFGCTPSEARATAQQIRRDR